MNATDDKHRSDSSTLTPEAVLEQPIAQYLNAPAILVAAPAPSRLVRLLPYAVAISITALICGSVWPGFMSNDSFQILHQARYGVTSNAHPPMVSYIQALCERVCPGPGGLFVFQVGLFFLALADILVVSAVPLPLSIACLLFMALSPAMLGPMLCVWKDTGMLAFFMASFGAITRADSKAKSAKWWSVGAIFLLFMGASFRYNGIVSAIPLIWASTKNLSKSRQRLALTGFLVVLIAGATFGLSAYRLPDLKPIQDARLLTCTYRFDIIGIAATSGDLALLPPAAYAPYSSFTVADLKRDYFPEHVNKSFSVWRPQQKPLRDWPLSPSAQADLWRHAVISHPGAYLKHRWNTLKALLGIGRNRPCYITHGTIDINDEGVELKPNAFTPQVMSYVWERQSTPFGFPWFYYGAAVVLALLMVLKRVPANNGALLIISAFLVLLPLAIVTPSTDLRYNLWALGAIILAVVLTLSSCCKAAHPEHPPT